jgi:hypothetical protein
MTQLLYVASTSGFLSDLEESNCDLEHLVEVYGYHSDTCARFIRCLKALGIVCNASLTPFGRTLLPARRSRTFLELVDAYEFETPTVLSLASVLKSGSVAFEKYAGQSLYQFNHSNPRQGALHDELLAHRSVAPSVELADNIDLPNVKTLVDVGGGYGLFCQRLVEMNKTIECTIFDTQRVVNDARRHLKGLDSLAFEAGDFFRSVPSGADAYVLKWVLHNWPDEACLEILRSVRSACGPESQLVVAEWILENNVDEDPASSLNAIMADITMLLYHGGRERTAIELDDLLLESGFRPGMWQKLPSGRSYSVCHV